MTLLSKISLILFKPRFVEKKCDEEVIEVQDGGDMSGMYWNGETRLSVGAIIYMTFLALILALVGISSGFVLYRHFMYPYGRTSLRFSGYCSIPIKEPGLYEANYRVMPLRWSAEPEEQVQVFSAAEDEDTVESALREQLDIGDSVEKISVEDNGRQVNFIHDFAANVTGIVDSERCFTMDLDPELVLSPELFVLSIEGGGEFDVSHVRSTVRAALPALQNLALAVKDLAEFCVDKPIYNLIKEEGVIIRKRGVDAPPHDYIQFAGRHVQEIQISNLADLLQHEQALRGD